jgi:hypothetical protein
MLQLFRGQSVFDYIEEQKNEAIKRAELTPEKKLSDPAVIDQIIGDFRFEVAVIRPEERKGKRRIVQRRISDYGQPRIEENVYIDVYIPFSGYPKSFEIGPSSSILIYEECRIDGSAIVVVFPDDDALDASVEAFIAQVTNNLENLKNDLRSAPLQIHNAVVDVVARRRNLIESRTERDKKRSFPIE